MTTGEGKKRNWLEIQAAGRAPRSHKNAECLKRVLSIQECTEQSGGTKWPGMYRGAMSAPTSEKGKEGIEQLEEW